MAWKALKEINLKVGDDINHTTTVIATGGIEWAEKENRPKYTTDSLLIWVLDAGRWYFSSREMQPAWNAIPDAEKHRARMLLLEGTPGAQGKPPTGAMHMYGEIGSAMAKRGSK